MTSPRLRIRTLMIAVAIVGLAIEARREWRLARFYRNLAEWHESEEDEQTFQRESTQTQVDAATEKLRKLVRAIRAREERRGRSLGGDEVIRDEDFESGVRDEDDMYVQMVRRLEISTRFEIRRLTDEIRTAETLADLHDSLRIKYDRAARYPWLSVSSDADEPKPDWFAMGRAPDRVPNVMRGAIDGYPSMAHPFINH